MIPGAPVTLTGFHNSCREPPLVRVQYPMLSHSIAGARAMLLCRPLPVRWRTATANLLLLGRRGPGPGTGTAFDLGIWLLPTVRVRVRVNRKPHIGVHTYDRT